MSHSSGMTIDLLLVMDGLQHRSKNSVI